MNIERDIPEARECDEYYQPEPPRRTGDCDLCGEWSGDLIEGECRSCYAAARPRRGQPTDEAGG